MSKRLISRLSIILLSSLMVIQSCQTPNIISESKKFSVKFNGDAVTLPINSVSLSGEVGNVGGLKQGEVNYCFSDLYVYLEGSAYEQSTNITKTFSGISFSSSFRFNDYEKWTLNANFINSSLIEGNEITSQLENSIYQGPQRTPYSLSGTIKMLPTRDQDNKLLLKIKLESVSGSGTIMRDCGVISSMSETMTLSSAVLNLYPNYTSSPSPTPTPYPSSTPTILPTVVPTTTPTINPTITPTLEPSISPPFYGVGDLIPGQIPSPINYNSIWTGGDANNPCTSKNPDGSKGSFTIASAFDFHTKNSTPSGGPDITLVVVPTSNYSNTNGNLSNSSITSPDITIPRSDLVHSELPNFNDCKNLNVESNKYKNCINNDWSSYISQDVSSAPISVYPPDVSKLVATRFSLEPVQAIIQDLQKKKYEKIGTTIIDGKTVSNIYTLSLDLNGTTKIRLIYQNKLNYALITL